MPNDSFAFQDYKVVFSSADVGFRAGSLLENKRAVRSQSRLNR